MRWPKNGRFFAKKSIFGLSKKPLRRFQTEYFSKIKNFPAPKGRFWLQKRPFGAFETVSLSGLLFFTAKAVQFLPIGSNVSYETFKKV